MLRQLPPEIHRLLDEHDVHDLSFGDTARGASGTTHACPVHGRRYRAWSNKVAWYSFVVFWLGTASELVASRWSATGGDRTVATVLAYLGHGALALSLLTLLVIAVWRTKTTHHVWIEIADEDADADRLVAEFGQRIEDVRAWRLPTWPVHEAWMVLRQSPSAAADNEARQRGIDLFVVPSEIESPRARAA